MWSSLPKCLPLTCVRFGMEGLCPTAWPHASGLHRNCYRTYISSTQLHNVLLAEHPASVLLYSFKICMEYDNNLNTGLAVPDAWTDAQEKEQKVLREPRSLSFFEKRCQWHLQSPKSPETPVSTAARHDGWLCPGAEARAEGGHNSQRKEHIEVLCGEHVHFNCWGTMLLHTTHGLRLWLSGTVCPYTCNMARLFFTIIF